jgi:hypothetical protein
MSYPRRQHYRRLARAGAAAAASATATLLALLAASAGAVRFAGVLLLTAVGLGLYARRWLQAAWPSRRRRRWCRHGALAVLCLARARGVQRVERDVLVVSIDRVALVLRAAAGPRARPAFLSGSRSNSAKMVAKR